jgi:hypothetical protein
MKNWIVVIDKGMDGFFVERVSGTTRQIKKYLLELVKKDRKINERWWKDGTTSINGENSGIFEGGGKLYAYGFYDEFEYRYVATPEMDVRVLS